MFVYTFVQHVSEGDSWIYWCQRLWEQEWNITLNETKLQVHKVFSIKHQMRNNIYFMSTSKPLLSLIHPHPHHKQLLNILHLIKQVKAKSTMMFIDKVQFQGTKALVQVLRLFCCFIIDNFSHFDTQLLRKFVDSICVCSGVRCVLTSSKKG